MTRSFLASGPLDKLMVTLMCDAEEDPIMLDLISLPWKPGKIEQALSKQADLYNPHHECWKLVDDGDRRFWAPRAMQLSLLTQAEMWKRFDLFFHGTEDVPSWLFALLALLDQSATTLDARRTTHEEYVLGRRSVHKFCFASVLRWGLFHNAFR